MNSEEGRKRIKNILLESKKFLNKNKNLPSHGHMLIWPVSCNQRSVYFM